jgi:IPT/TIG domain
MHRMLPLQPRKPSLRPSALTLRTLPSSQISVEPAPPFSLGSGIFPGSIAITGYFCANPECSSLAAGNTQTVSVRYQISPVIQTIAPYVGFVNVSDTAIIRGVGFQSFAPQGVRFGDAAAVEFTIANDTDMRVIYPALPAGSYEVQIDIPALQGTLQSEARLVIIEPTNYVAQGLPYPSTGATVQKLVYDAERGAVIVATEGGSLIRYAYSAGAWQAPTTVNVNELQDIILSTRGEHLLTLTRSSLIVADPVTLAPINTLPAQGLASGVFFKRIAATNEDRAFVTTGQANSGATPVHLYNGRTSTLISTAQTLNNATPAPAGQGSSVLFVRGHPNLSTPPPVFIFSTTTPQFQPLGVSINQNNILPVVDKRGTRAVLNGVRVHGSTVTESFKLLGTLPDSTVATVLDMPGSRAYTYDGAAGGILAFDVSVDRNGEAYAPLGAAVALPADPGANVRMTISPDGRALFLAGSNQLVVLPTPAL